MGLRFGSLFSGIEAASVAWGPLGWECAWTAEIEPFPCAALAHHYPEVPNLGDVMASDFIARLLTLGQVDLVMGGSPCQAFSVAGLRQSLSDDRGNLTLRYMEIVNAIGPRFALWENVPGVLNTKDNAFGCLLAGLVGEDAPLVPVGGRWTDAGVVDGPIRSVAWRVLDAQYFGLAQRRRRVFLLAGRAGDRPHPAEVLFEPESLRRHSPPGRETGQGVARSLMASTGSGQRNNGTEDTFIATTLRARAGSKGVDSDCTDTLVAHTLRAEGFDASEDGTGRGTPLVIAPAPCVAFQDRFRGDDGRGYDRPPPVTEEVIGSLETVKPWHVAHFIDAWAIRGSGSPNQHPIKAGELSDALDTTGPGAVATLAIRGRGGQNNLEYRSDGTANALLTPNGGRAGIGVGAIHTGMTVRRLTPRECERLQGFPDNYTLIPWRGRPAGDCHDGPRYKALGNSMAVPVVRWIGERLIAALVRANAAQAGECAA